MGTRRNDVTATMRRGLLLVALMLVVPAQAAKQSAVPNRFGAIAYHRASGSYGFAVDRRSAREAKVEALKQCSNTDCEVVLSLKASCGAVAKSPKSHFASRGTTREEAETKARRQCGARCEVVVWACTK